MKLLGQLAVSLIVLAVGTVVGVLVQQGRSERDARTRFLDARVSSSEGLLNQARIPGRQIAVSLDGKAIENISQVSVAIYNLADIDFENVPIYIELKPKSGSPVEVVNGYAVGAAGLPEGVVPISGLAPTRTTGAVRYGYTIKTVNRSRDDEVFFASFFVLGESTPEVSVSLDKKGLAIRPFSYSNLTEENWFDVIGPLVIAVAGISVYVGLLAFLLRRARKKQRSGEETLARDMVQALEAPGKRVALGLPPDTDLSKLVSLMIRESKRIQWEKIPKLMRPLFRYLDPGNIEQPGG